MISVKQADQIISENIREFPIVEISLEKAVGAILQEDLKADRDLPPFNKSLMDGIAVKWAAWKSGVREFKITAIQAAGTPPVTIKRDNECAEIMTGAVLTRGADCVIPVECLTIKQNSAYLNDDVKLQPMLNIRPKGADHKKGVVLVEKGCILTPAKVATAAAIGKSKVKVSYQPRVAIISTGDEIVDIDADIKPYQVRKSNSYFIKSALDNTRLFNSSAFHFKDDRKILLRQIAAILDEFDVLVLTGGVSMGKFDYIPGVMEELGVKLLFHKVKQKPGRPFWFGKSKKHQPVFALPGNPVSTQVGIMRYVIPSLKTSLNLKNIPEEYAVLSRDYQPDTLLTFFLTVQLTYNKKGTLEAYPVATGGSGDFAGTAVCDGFMELPANLGLIKAGFSGKVYRW